MWDWSNSNKKNQGEVVSKKETTKELDELFSLDNVETKNNDKVEEEKEISDFKEVKVSKTGLAINNFSVKKTLKSGAKEDGVSKSIASIPPPPQAIKRVSPFIRPTAHRDENQNSKKGVSGVYMGATGMREPVPSHGDKSMWELQLRQAGLPSMALAEINYSPIDDAWRADLLKAFKRIRRDFLKYVGYHNLDDLVSAGIDENGIKLLKSGRAPENFDVHLKIPLEYGGNNEFSNLCLIQTRPFHEAIHKFIDMQTSNLNDGEILRNIFIPVPSGKVYVPEVEVSTGGGRKMPDKSVYSGFLSDTFKEIAIKSMFGKSRSID